MPTPPSLRVSSAVGARTEANLPDGRTTTTTTTTTTTRSSRQPSRPRSARPRRCGAAATARPERGVDHRRSPARRVSLDLSSARISSARSPAARDIRRSPRSASPSAISAGTRPRPTTATARRRLRTAPTRPPPRRTTAPRRRRCRRPTFGRGARRRITGRRGLRRPASPGRGARPRTPGGSRRASRPWLVSCTASPASSPLRRIQSRRRPRGPSRSTARPTSWWAGFRKEASCWRASTAPRAAWPRPRASTAKTRERSAKRPRRRGRIGGSNVVARFLSEYSSPRGVRPDWRPPGGWPGARDRGRYLPACWHSGSRPNPTRIETSDR